MTNRANKYAGRCIGTCRQRIDAGFGYAVKLSSGKWAVICPPCNLARGEKASTDDGHDARRDHRASTTGTRRW